MHPSKFTSVTTLPYAIANTKEKNIQFTEALSSYSCCKVFLESSFYHYVKIVAEGFVTLLRTTTSTPPPSPYRPVGTKLGTKLNCRRPLIR